jgi:membrane protein DedA with SNARE-associated domain
MEFLPLESLLDLARQHGYLVIFAGILLENMGIPLPGETLTLVGGFLAGSDELRYHWVLLSAISGAIVGDNFGYWLGRLGGWSLIERAGSFFRIPQARLLQVQAQFKDNAVKAVILGRFVALLRIFAGPLAGLSQMTYSRFLACNALGACLWGFVMVSLSFFLGQIVPLEKLVAWVLQFGLGALVLVVALIGFWIWREYQQTHST